MTKDQMLEAISKLQSIPFMYCNTKAEAEDLYWQIADLGWSLMVATNVNAVNREQFEEKQAALFDIAWRMARGKKEEQKEFVDEWPDVIE